MALSGTALSRAVQLSSARVVNHNRRAGGAAGTLGHDLAPGRVEEAEGGQPGSRKSQEEEGGKSGSRGRRGRKGGAEESSWTRGEGRNAGVRVGGCQAWRQVTGALGASRIFTNEGSKKEKK